MDRREFLRAAGMASLCTVVPGFEAWAVEGASEKAAANKLVVVFLRGAIDGLSVVVPYSDPGYYAIRPKIAITRPGAPGAAIALDRDFALHPSLAPLMPLWQDRSLAFVLNSGSPDPTRSHFDAQDFMESGMPGNKVASTGWLNRVLGQLPNNHSPVRAINVGATTPRILEGPIASASFAPNQVRGRSPIDRPGISAAFMDMYNGRNDELEKTFKEGVAARSTINTTLADDGNGNGNGNMSMSQEQVAANQGAVPAAKFGSFGKQLGKLIHDEPKVQVAFVALGGFDTHINQGADKGQLANHLNVLGNGLSDLAQALGPTFSNTMVLVVSEFGRTVKENGNGGTDHGHGNVMWLMGGKVNGGKLYGRFNGLAQNELYEGRDLPVSTDFRSVIGSVIAEHMSLSSGQMQSIFPNFTLADRSLSNILRA